MGFAVGLVFSILDHRIATHPSWQLWLHLAVVPALLARGARQRRLLPYCEHHLCWFRPSYFAFPAGSADTLLSTAKEGNLPETCPPKTTDPVCLVEVWECPRDFLPLWDDGLHTVYISVKEVASYCGASRGSFEWSQGTIRARMVPVTSQLVCEASPITPLNRGRTPDMGAFSLLAAFAFMVLALMGGWFATLSDPELPIPGLWLFCAVCSAAACATFGSSLRALWLHHAAMRYAKPPSS